MNALRGWLRENPQIPLWVASLFVGQSVFFHTSWSQLGLDITVAIFTAITVFLDEEPGYRSKIKAAVTGVVTIAILALIAAREHLPWMQPDFVVFSAMAALAALAYLLIGDFTRGMTSGDVGTQ